MDMLLSVPGQFS